jgi:beta-glucosidase/6-phospho-beta-glucosidase/beta-galactosidase
MEDRNIRNDICILINYVVSSPDSHVHFINKDEVSETNESSKRSFLDILLHYATYDETLSITKEIEIQTKIAESDKKGVKAKNLSIF